MKIPREKANSGQTLIEPLLAIAIFGLLLTPFLSSMSNLAHSQVKYRHQIQAAQFAREGMETAYNQVVNYPGDLEDLVGSSSYSEGRFTRTVAIEKARRNNDDDNVTEETDSGLTWEDNKTLKVVSGVTWEERGRLQEIELITYLIDLEVLL